jgi:uncharacterized caspase-like protein
MLVRPISLFQWLIVVALVVLTDASFALADDRFALIIGNSNYREDDSFPTLQNAISDAELLGSALKKAGYSVVSVTDCTAEEIQDSVRNFSAKLPINAEAAFFFSGHGFQVEKEPCLLGIDASVSDEKLTSNTIVPIASVIEQIAARKPRVSLFFLDCCRELALYCLPKMCAAIRSVFCRPSGEFRAFLGVSGSIPRPLRRVPRARW